MDVLDDGELGVLKKTILDTDVPASRYKTLPTVTSAISYVLDHSQRHGLYGLGQRQPDLAGVLNTVLIDDNIFAV